MQSQMTWSSSYTSRRLLLLAVFLPQALIPASHAAPVILPATPRQTVLAAPIGASPTVWGHVSSKQLVANQQQQPVVHSKTGHGNSHPLGGAQARSLKVHLALCIVLLIHCVRSAVSARYRTVILICDACPDHTAMYIHHVQVPVQRTPRQYLPVRCGVPFMQCRLMHAAHTVLHVTVTRHSAPFASQSVSKWVCRPPPCKSFLMHARVFATTCLLARKTGCCAL